MAEKRKALLNLLAESALCTCLSDLRDVPKKKQRTLVKRLEAIPPEDYSLAVWNDALTYLTGEPAAPTSETAKAMLMNHYIKSEA